MKLPGGAPVGGGANASSTFAQTVSPLAIVGLVLVIGASIYLWRQRYLHSRAALITIGAVVAVLIYFGFFAMQPPT
jgi:hypothetical protein